MAYERAHPCAYENCGNIIERTESGGRVKQYCNSTCRSNQCRLNQERAEHKRLADADRQKFLQFITGTPPQLEPKLAELRRRRGDGVLADVVYFIKEAIGQTAPSAEMIEAWVPGAAQRQQEAWHSNPAIPVSIIPMLIDIQKRLGVVAANEAAQVAIQVHETTANDVWWHVAEQSEMAAYADTILQLREEMTRDRILKPYKVDQICGMARSSIFAASVCYQLIKEVLKNEDGESLYAQSGETLQENTDRGLMAQR